MNLQHGFKMENKMKKRNLLLASFLGFFISLNAQADTLDFTEVGSTGIVATTVINLSNATITTGGDDFFIGAPGSFGEANNLGIVCGSPSGNSSCEEGMQIAFLSDVSNLTFASFGASSGDNVEVSAFFGATLLGSLTVTTNTAIDFSAFGTISSLSFADNSTAAGIGFGDFDFNVASVPEASSIMLLGLGLAGLGFTRRKKSS